MPAPDDAAKSRAGRIEVEPLTPLRFIEGVAITEAV
jgi:hypothetical protein